MPWPQKEWRQWVELSQVYSALAAILRNDSDEKACTFAISKCGRRIILQAPFVLWWKKSQLLCSCTPLINFHAWIISISLSPLFGRGERKAIWHNMKCHYWQAIQEKEKVLTAILDTPSFANDLRQCIYRICSLGFHDKENGYSKFVHPVWSWKMTILCVQCPPLDRPLLERGPNVAAAFWPTSQFSGGKEEVSHTLLSEKGRTEVAPSSHNFSRWETHLIDLRRRRC